MPDPLIETDHVIAAEAPSEPAIVFAEAAPEPAPPKAKHALNVIAGLFRTEANGASGPVAASLLRLADSFDNYAKGL